MTPAGAALISKIANDKLKNRYEPSLFINFSFARYAGELIRRARLGRRARALIRGVRLGN